MPLNEPGRLAGRSPACDDGCMYLCLFDVDGTLVNTGGAGQAAMEAALRREFGAGGAAHGVSAAGRTDRAIIRDLLAFYGLPVDETTIRRVAAAYLQELPEALRARSGQVLPGVVDLLKRLSAREDVLLGLLTGNFREGARLKLEHYAIAHHFSGGGFGDEHLHRDDVAREAWHEFRRRTDGRLSRHRVWVIGDTPSDVACGRAIGARVLAVATGIFGMDELSRSRPDLLLADFTSAESLLELLTG